MNTKKDKISRKIFRSNELIFFVIKNLTNT